MIAGICGYGYTGSGAVIDLLKSYEKCDTSIGCEFSLAYIPHGIQDLEYRMFSGTSRGFSSDVGIKEFFLLIRALDSPRGPYRHAFGKSFKKGSVAFINKLIQLKWSGISWDDSIVLKETRNMFYRQHIQGRIMSMKERITNERAKAPKSDVMYLSIQPENFIEEVRHYIHSLLYETSQSDKDIIVLDQPFNVNNPKTSMRYFDAPRAILVDRDPRDIYVLAKKYLKSNGSFIPSDNVEDYIIYHRLIRTRCEEEDGPDILRMSFEDLIYDYEATSARIQDFLGLSGSKHDEKKYFDPAVSIENTQLFLKHPELADDIQKIEKALPEYLYPFEKYTLKPKHIVDAF